jgi:hypothetical protein
MMAASMVHVPNLISTLQPYKLVAVNCSAVELLSVEAYRAKFLTDAGKPKARDAYYSETDVIAKTAARWGWTSWMQLKLDAVIHTS